MTDVESHGARLESALSSTAFGPHLRCRLRPHRARPGGRAAIRALLVHSGSLLTVFEDDRTYPFEVHAPFKVWTPLTDVPDCFVYFEPGHRPAPAVPPSARLSGTSRADLPACLLDAALRHPSRSPTARPRATLLPQDLEPQPPTSAMPFPSWRVGESARSTRRPRCDVWISSRREDPLRAGLPARGEPPRGARTPRRGRGLSQAGRLRVRDRARLPARPAACANRSCPTTRSSR